MTNTFYIAHHRTVGGDWYMLIVRDTHFCLSCGSDLDRIVTALRRCVKRTRTKERLMRELRGLDCGGTISPATFDQREEWYREHGKDFFDLVHSTVEEALKEAAKKCKAVLLEPIMSVDVTAPADYLGSVMGDITKRRGQIRDQEEKHNAITVKAFVPLSEMFGYATDLRSFTQGRGNYVMQMDHYSEVPKNIAEKVAKKMSGDE